MMNGGGAMLRWTGMAALALLLAVQGACGIRPYQLDVQQGNVVTQEMLSKLRLDMTRSQVKFVLGTPLVASVFRPERWDYYYRSTKGGRAGNRRLITLIFEEDKLKRILGDVPEAPGLKNEPATAVPAPIPK